MRSKKLNKDFEYIKTTHFIVNNQTIHNSDSSRQAKQSGKTTSQPNKKDFSLCHSSSRSQLNNTLGTKVNRTIVKNQIKKLIKT